MKLLLLKKVKTLYTTVPPTAKNMLLWGIKLFISVLVLTVLINKISYQEIRRVIEQAHLFFIFAAVLLLALNLFFQFKKWQLLVRLQKATAENREILFSLLAGITLGFITPGRVGEFARPLFIENSNRLRLLGLVFVDKIFALTIISILGALSICYFLKQQLFVYLWLAFLLALLLLVGLAFLSLLHPGMPKAGPLRYDSFYMRHQKIRQFVSSLQLITARTAQKLLALTILNVLTYILQFHFLISAFCPLPIYKSFLAISSTLIVKTLLPISIGDLGVRESAAIFFFNHFGVQHAASFNASLLLFMINILVPCLLGLILILKNRFNSTISTNIKIFE